MADLLERSEARGGASARVLTRTSYSKSTSMSSDIWGQGMFRFRASVAVLIGVYVFSFGGPVSAQAWDGVKTGRITGIDTTDGANFGFRVYSDGTPMCGTSEGWAYMNSAWDNYQATAALLTSAYTSGKQVTIFTVRQGVNCEIHYVAFR